MNNQIIGVYDADFLPYFVCFNKKDAEEKTEDDCIRICDEFIANINKSILCDQFVGFLTKGKCFRYDIYPEYKGNRKYLDPPKYMNEVKSHLMYEYGFTSVDGYEADDAVVSYKKANPQYDCIIISPDKDLLNLEGTNYNPRKADLIYTSKEDADTYFWKSMIVGDNADNIKGCRGIGEVGAEKIINSKSIFGSLREVVLEQYCKTYGEREGIRQFYINYYMLTLVDNIDPILLDVKLNKVKILSE